MIVATSISSVEYSRCGNAWSSDQHARARSRHRLLGVGVEHAAKGPDAVAEVVNGQLERSRLDYEEPNEIEGFIASMSA